MGKCITPDGKFTRPLSVLIFGRTDPVRGLHPKVLTQARGPFGMGSLRCEGVLRQAYEPVASVQRLVLGIKPLKFMFIQLCEGMPMQSAKGQFQYLLVAAVPFAKCQSLVQGPLCGRLIDHKVA